MDSSDSLGAEWPSLPLAPQFKHLAAPAFMSNLFHEVLLRTNSPSEAREAVRIAATALSHLVESSDDAAPNSSDE